MNFENMNEFHAAYNPLAPGVKIVWFCIAILYSFVFFVSMHCKLFYAVS